MPPPIPGPFARAGGSSLLLNWKLFCLRAATIHQLAYSLDILDKKKFFLLMANCNWMMGFLITYIKYHINIRVHALCSYSNTASNYMVWCDRKVHQKEGSKNARFPQLILWISRQKVYCLIKLELYLVFSSICFCVLQWKLSKPALV